MTTWFAQNSSVNIDSAAQWNSVAGGGGTVLTWASLAAGDILVANGKTSITCNVSFTCATITTAATGGTAGGGFILSDGITVTASPVAGSTSCIIFAAASPASATIIGAPQGSLTATAHGAVNSGSGTLNITGNPLGDIGTGSSQNSCGVINISTGTVNVTGNPKGGSGTYGLTSNGVTNSAAGVINITGNPVGGVYYGNNCGAYNASTGTINITGNPRGRDNDGGVSGGFTAGAYNGSSGTININGNVSGGLYGNSPGAVNFAGGLIVVNGTVTPTANGAAVLNNTQSGRIVANGNWLALGTGHFAVGTGIVMIHPTSELSIAFRVNSSGTPGAERSLYTGGVNLGQPVASNVRSGQMFGVSSEYVGTLAVPSPTLVAEGVATDNTVGSYNPAPSPETVATAVWNRVRANSNTPGTFGAVREWAGNQIPLVRNKAFYTTPGGLRSLRNVTVEDLGNGFSNMIMLAPPYRNLALGNAAVAIKETTAKVYGWVIVNDTDDICYLRFYSSASAPTVGVTTPYRSIPYGPQQVGEVVVGEIPQFQTPQKLWVCVVRGNPDTGNTALTKTVFVEVLYL